jgi:hypothetical protein
MQAYSDPKRENDPHALPNVEVFALDGSINDDVADENGEPLEAGWYWWSCFPGCLPDSDPFGPFATESEALADAQENADDESDDASCDSCAACMVNGTYCHETGCRNARKVKVDGCWITPDSDDDAQATR